MGEDVDFTGISQGLEACCRLELADMHLYRVLSSCSSRICQRDGCMVWDLCASELRSLYTSVCAGTTCVLNPRHLAKSLAITLILLRKARSQNSATQCAVAGEQKYDKNILAFYGPPDVSSYGLYSTPLIFWRGFLHIWGV